MATAMIELPIIREIEEQLSKVSPDTMWGQSIHKFLMNKRTNLAEDYRELIRELKSQMMDSETTMKTILGPAFDFVKNLKPSSIPDENLNLFENRMFLIKKALNKYKVPEAARLLGITQRSLYRFKPMIK